MKKSLFTLLTVVLTLFSCCISQDTVAQKSSGLDNTAIEKSMIKALEWQEAHPIFAIHPTDWTAGAYYTGVARAHHTTKNMMYMAALKNQAVWNNWQTYKRIYHADDVAISYSYLYLAMNENRRNFADLEPTKKFLDEHLYEDNRWKEGKDKSHEDKTILWWWCDALFMAPPVINLYAKHTKEPKYLDAMHKYYMEAYDRLFDKEENLFARDMRFIWKGDVKDKKESNGEKVFWSRGNGWVIGGLALLLEDMPKNYKHRGFYVNLYKKMAARILEIQPEDGLWRTSLLSPES